MPVLSELQCPHLRKQVQLASSSQSWGGEHGRQQPRAVRSQPAPEEASGSHQAPSSPPPQPHSSCSRLAGSCLQRAELTKPEQLPPQNVAQPQLGTSFTGPWALLQAFWEPALCLHLLEAQPSWGKADSGAVQSWGAGTPQAFLEASATPNWHETLGKVSAPPGAPNLSHILAGFTGGCRQNVREGQEEVHPVVAAIAVVLTRRQRTKPACPEGTAPMWLGAQEHLGSPPHGDSSTIMSPHQTDRESEARVGGFFPR